MGCNSSSPAKTAGSPHDNLSGGQNGDQETRGLNDNVQHKHLRPSTTQNIYSDEGGSKSFINTENYTEIEEPVCDNAMCAIDKSVVSEGKSECTNANAEKEQQKEEIPSDSVEQGEKDNDNDQQQMTIKVEQKRNEGKTTVGF